MIRLITGHGLSQMPLGVSKHGMEVSEVRQGYRLGQLAFPYDAWVCMRWGRCAGHGDSSSMGQGDCMSTSITESDKAYLISIGTIAAIWGPCALMGGI